MTLLMTADPSPPFRAGFTPASLPPSFPRVSSVPSAEKEEEEECVICIQQCTALTGIAFVVVVIAAATDQLTD